MAKLKDRKLYKRGILKLNNGGMVPQSPFTSAGLGQAGISALNTIKNPQTYLVEALVFHKSHLSEFSFVPFNSSLHISKPNIS